jgi:hypothetical protein
MTGFAPGGAAAGGTDPAPAFDHLQTGQPTRPWPNSMPNNSEDFMPLNGFIRTFGDTPA